VFDDVDEEARLLQAGAGTQTQTGATSSASGIPGAVLASAPISSLSSPAPSPKPETVTEDSQLRGLLARNLHHYAPSLFDPVGKSLVWGAPPVDKIGRISDRIEPRP